ncbi:MAG: ABC transporter permease [Chloroflexi bacterium]|nr:ABC transporter permease [Chloroflexota bacterium]
MRRYLILRILQAILAIFAVSFIVFVTTRLSGDVTILMLPFDATEENRLQFRQELGLDKPLYIQYGIFLIHAARGDLGESHRWRKPAMKLILDRMPATIQLASVSVLFTVVFAIPIGVISAVRPGSWMDTIGKTFALLGQSMPNFWVGLLLILIFAVRLDLLPPAGRGGWQHLVLPAITLGSGAMAAVTRLTRSGMLDVMDSEFIKMARIKGIPEHLVIWKHGLKNAAIPVVTVLGLQIAGLLGGSVIAETIFSWPGVGKQIVDAIYARDYAVVQAGVLLTSIIHVGANLGVDVLYAYIDPRIRYA